jgi:hypothetical protein
MGMTIRAHHLSAVVSLVVAVAVLGLCLAFTTGTQGHADRIHTLIGGHAEVAAAVAAGGQRRVSVGAEYLGGDLVRTANVDGAGRQTRAAASPSFGPGPEPFLCRLRI